MPTAKSRAAISNDPSPSARNAQILRAQRLQRLQLFSRAPDLRVRILNLHDLACRRGARNAAAKTRAGRFHCPACAWAGRAARPVSGAGLSDPHGRGRAHHPSRRGRPIRSRCERDGRRIDDVRTEPDQHDQADEESAHPGSTAQSRSGPDPSDPGAGSRPTIIDSINIDYRDNLFGSCCCAT